MEASTPAAGRTAHYADMFAALGAEPRLRILRTLLAAHPDGMVVGEIQAELGIVASTLSQHLEKLKHEDLIGMRRESTFLRYTANTAALEELLGFLYAECCTRNKALKPQDIVQISKYEIPWASQILKMSSKRNTVRLLSA